MHPLSSPERGRRRGRTVGLALLFGVASITGCSGPDHRAAPTTTVDPGAPDPRPNVVLIVVDDLDSLTMPFWDAMPQTAELLRDHGLTFSNSFVSSPECCPARASALTGNYPHNTQVFDATPPDGGWPRFRDSGSEADTFATRLDAAGYRTAFLGKYLNGYEEKADAVPPGWDEWWGLGPGFHRGYNYAANHNGEMEHYGNDEADYQTDVLTDLSVAELRRDTVRNQPFAVTIWPSAPHDAIPAAKRDADNPFASATVPERANFDEADVSDKPTWLREGVRRLTARDRADLTRRYRMMMGSMYAVDDLVARVVGTVDEAGLLDDTYFIFTSDNGYNFGAHRLPHKMVPYEESIRVPLVVAGPGVRHGTDDHLVLNNDLAPTLLDLAGVPWDDIDGRSLRPLFADPGDEAVAWRSDFPIQYHGRYGEYFIYDSLAATIAAIPSRLATPDDEAPLAFVPDFTALRTERWLYVDWYSVAPHEYELYDLDADPYQLTNLLASPAGMAANRATVDTLASRLATLMACTGPTCRQ